MIKNKLSSTLLSVAIFGAITAMPIVTSHQPVMAVNLPNFVPKLDLTGNVASLTIPKDLMEASLRQTLKINEQRLKDTEFNKFTLKGTDVTIIGDQLEVSGVLQAKHRELIAKVFGRKKFTPWVSVSGKISQRFSIKVIDNQTVVRNIGDPKITGLESRWYADFISLAGKFVGPKLTPEITKHLSNFNGLDIRQFAISAAVPPLSSRLRLSESTVQTELQKNIGSINAGINAQSNFLISFTIPAIK